MGDGGGCLTACRGCAGRSKECEEETREACGIDERGVRRPDDSDATPGLSHVVLSDCDGTDSGLSATKEKVDPMNVPSTVAGEFGGQSVRRQFDEDGRESVGSAPMGRQVWRTYSGGVQRTDPVHPDAPFTSLCALGGVGCRRRTEIGEWKFEFENAVEENTR
jgi:hypothetical protein